MGRRALSTSNIGPDTVIDARNSGATPIDAPLRVDGEHSVSWDDHCDVLVVGFGAAGASAAIEAAGAGADVIVTDRFRGGGASAKSGGVVYAGGGTRFQKTAGYDDSPEAMYEYLCMEVGDAVDRATLRDFCDRSVEMIEWLEAHGVEFDSRPCRRARPRIRPTATTCISPATKPLRSMPANIRPRRAAIASKARGCRARCCFARCARASMPPARA